MCLGLARQCSWGVVVSHGLVTWQPVRACPMATQLEQSGSVHCEYEGNGTYPFRLVGGGTIGMCVNECKGRADAFQDTALESLIVTL
jgi:hypothetical protein